VRERERPERMKGTELKGEAICAKKSLLSLFSFINQDSERNSTHFQRCIIQAEWKWKEKKKKVLTEKSLLLLLPFPFLKNRQVKSITSQTEIKSREFISLEFNCNFILKSF